MSIKPLPGTAVSIRSLIQNGDPFATAPLVPRPLGEGLTYRHPREGARPIAADDRVLDATGTIYAASAPLRRALRARGARVASLVQANRLIQTQLSSPGLILGVSGYASIGHPCDIEAQVLGMVYGRLLGRRSGIKPVAVWDGASAAGVLGLNGMFARDYRLPAFGITPLQGIASMAPRRHMVVYGQTYRDREILVGAMPDLLVCDGGGEGAGRECVHAIQHGVPVLLIIPEEKDTGPDSLARTWQQYPDLVSARGKGQLIVCKSIGALPGCIDEAAVLGLHLGSRSRARRKRAIARYVSR